jgi:hypothetical protein
LPWIAATLLGGIVGGAQVEQSGGPDLTLLLARMERVARLYSDVALRFVSRETIAASPGPTRSFDYVYIFGEDGKFRDYRTRVGDRSGKEVNLEAAGMPRWLNQAFSWAFIFRSNRRERYHFELEGEAQVLGRTAYRLRFEPIPPIEKNLNDWFGTVWIDRSTSQILRVEAQTPEDFDERWRLARRLAASPVSPKDAIRPYFSVESITTQFGVEKNGMTFPSEVLIERSRFTIPGRSGERFDTRLVYRVRQTYDDYRFFSVHTADEIRAILSRSAPNPNQTLPENPRPP